MSTKIAQVRIGYNTDVGQARDHNEDSFLWSDPADDKQALQRRGRLYVVADGMGGHSAGEIASRIATSVITQQYEVSHSSDITSALGWAIRAANAEICRQQMQDDAQADMGTTVVCAVVRDAELYVAHVGDSRAYLFRGGRLRLLTEDHTLINELLRRHILGPDDVSYYPQRHFLTRALGRDDVVSPDFTASIQLQADDVVLLCTDGVSSYVEEAEIEHALQRNLADPQAAADTLIHLANAAGGDDNATVIIILIENITV